MFPWFSFSLNPKDGRITATVLHEKVLWIGTGGGQVAMVDVLKWTPLSITYRHTASVRCLLSVRLTGKMVLFVSGVIVKVNAKYTFHYITSFPV